MDQLDDAPPAGTKQTVELFLRKSRYVMAVPVVLLLLSALGTFVYGAVLFVDSTRAIVHHPFPVAKNIGFFVLLVDVMLVGATLLIAAYGLYELFIAEGHPDETGNVLPPWLTMKDLNDLKIRVVSMIVLISAVTFLEVLVDFQSGLDVLYLGTGVAVLIIALTVFNRYGVGDHGH